MSKFTKITLDRTPEQVQLIQDLVTKDVTKRSDARLALAAFIARVIQEVIPQASTSGAIYSDLTFDQNSDATIPLDLYRDEAAGYFNIWSQAIAGGIPTQVTHGVSEMKVQTFSLDSAISFRYKWAEQSRLDVIAKSLTKLAQEFTIAQDLQAWTVAFTALAAATHNSKKHVVRSNTAGVLLLEDFNKLLTHAKRINASFNNGTPDPSRGRGITDLFVSPEIMEQIRAMAYQPQNTRSGATTTSGATSIAAPESLREQVFRNGGVSELYNISLHELLELGVGYAYNNLFDNLAGATEYVKFDGSGSAAFDGTTSQLLVGVDATRESLIRPVEVNTETRGQYTVEEDDSFVKRSGKFGYFVKVEEGRICIDDRCLLGLIV